MCAVDRGWLCRLLTKSDIINGDGTSTQTGLFLTNPSKTTESYSDEKPSFWWHTLREFIGEGDEGIVDSFDV